MENYCCQINSELGMITIFADENAVTEITFGIRTVASPISNKWTEMAVNEIQLYLDGKLSAFSFPIIQKGTVFQQKVWQELLTIPHGHTISYLQLAKQMQNPLAIRAIAAANGKNNLAIVVPCHRVIGSNGKLVGYAGELWRKKWLLDHEKGYAQKGQMEMKF